MSCFSMETIWSCISMNALWRCIYPQEQPFFKKFTQPEFELLTAINQDALLEVTSSDVTYQTLDQLERGEHTTLPLTTAIDLLKRISNEQQARFFPKEQFHVYLALRYGNNKELLKNGYHTKVLELSCSK